MNFRVKLRDKDKIATEPDDLRVLNMSALTALAELRKRHEQDRCKDHPDHDQVLVLEVMEHGTLRLDKSGLCCAAFGDTVILN